MANAPIQSQLDQVLAKLEQEMRDAAEVSSVHEGISYLTVDDWADRLSVVRTAVGVGTVDSTCRHCGAPTRKEVLMRGGDNGWGDEASRTVYRYVRAAVGGEAVKVAWRFVDKTGQYAYSSWADIGAEIGDHDASRIAIQYAYASPAATVDVGASECRWTYDTDTPTDTAWDTQCGHRHQFTSDGPIENEHKFCPYCGGKLAALIGKEA